MIKLKFLKYIFLLKTNCANEQNFNVKELETMLNSGGDEKKRILEKIEESDKKVLEKEEKLNKVETALSDERIAKEKVEDELLNKHKRTQEKIRQMKVDMDKELLLECNNFKPTINHKSRIMDRQKINTRWQRVGKRNRKSY